MDKFEYNNSKTIDLVEGVTAIVRSDACNESVIFYLTATEIKYLRFSSANLLDVEDACIAAKLPRKFVYGSTNETGEVCVVGEVRTKGESRVDGILVMEVENNGKKELKLAHILIDSASKKPKQEKEEQGYQSF